ncbi:MAG: purine-nucleoside phosphorylase [Clostridiaceae bacterium]|nr:purine-nucleoside phosphorylase [Clostridiaceae bacterium]
MDNRYSYEYFKKAADYVLSRSGSGVDLALILGSSLGSLSAEIKNSIVIDYADIPNFPETTVDSHAGKLIIGDLGGKKLACMSGRFHYYEGYDFEQLVVPIRLFHLLGAKTVILTNAAGAVNSSFNVGDIMLIEDQIKIMGASPLRGPNLPEFGPRFFDVSDMYSKDLRELAKKCAGKIGLSLREGVYFYMSGPQFETPAEIRAVRALGGDAVGMSTAYEAITAAHCGMKVLGLSLMTNMAAGMLNQAVTAAEVDETAGRASAKFKELIREIIQEMS